MAWKLTRPKEVIAEEPARAQVQAILDHYQIDVEGIPDGDVRRGTEGALEKLMSFARQGLFEVQASPFQIIQHLAHPPGEASTITYPELSGKHKVAMDACEPKAMYKRIHALMAAMSELNEDLFRRLTGVDLSCMECLGMLFLSA